MVAREGSGADTEKLTGHAPADTSLLLTQHPAPHIQVQDVCTGFDLGMQRLLQLNVSNYEPRTHLCVNLIPVTKQQKVIVMKYKCHPFVILS